MRERRVCNTPGCGRGHKGRGKCAACLARIRRNGTWIRPTLADRFWRRVRKSDGCWEWGGAVRGKGYGEIGRGGRGQGVVDTHRLSWELHFGEIPEGLQVLHRCDNPPCVRPDHLFLGTVADNMADKAQKGRAPSISNPGEQAGRAKLTNADVLAIRRRAAAGERLFQIARSFPVSASTIGQVVNRKTWGHLARELEVA